MVHTTPTTLLALTGLAATATAYKHTWRDHMKCAVSIACLHVDLSKEASFLTSHPSGCCSPGCGLPNLHLTLQVLLLLRAAI